MVYSSSGTVDINTGGLLCLPLRERTGHVAGSRQPKPSLYQLPQSCYVEMGMAKHSCKYNVIHTFPSLPCVDIYNSSYLHFGVAEIYGWPYSSPTSGHYDTHLGQYLQSKRSKTMNINPYILLSIGSFFALLYACVITFGWRLTGRNRRTLQRDNGICRVPALILDPNIKNPPEYIETVSLSNNSFVDLDGNPINVDSFEASIAIGESSRFPGIKSGDLILKDSDRKICYVFSVPDLTDYR